LKERPPFPPQSREKKRKGGGIIKGRRAGRGEEKKKKDLSLYMSDKEQEMFPTISCRLAVKERTKGEEEKRREACHDLDRNGAGGRLKKGAKGEKSFVRGVRRETGRRE